MLDKDLYDSSKSRMELYMQNREHGIMIIESVENGPLIWPTIEENRVTKTKKYAELSATEKIQSCERFMGDSSITDASLPPEWSKCVTDVKLVKDLHTTTFDQLHAYLEQHELHANEVRLLREPNQDPLAFMANQQMTPPYFNTYQSSYNNPQLQQQFPPSQDDPIACLNKAMAFLMAVTSSRFPSTNNQLRTSSNPRNQATIQDGSVRVVECYNCQGKGHMAKQCTQPKRPRNAAWYKDTAMLAEAQEAGQMLNEEQLAFLADPGVPDGQAIQTIIPNNAAFQTEDLDTYDSDCDDISNAKAVLMANISNYGSDVILEVPHSETYLNDMENQSVHAMQDFEQTPAVDFTDNEIHSDSNIIPYSQYLQETQQENVQDTNLQAQQDSMILSVIEQMSEQMINHIRTTPDARTKGEWGFELTKAVFNNEIIPFLKSLKDIFNVFDRDLLNEIMEVQTVFDQIDAVVQQSLVDKQCLEIAKKELLLENDRLLQQIMSQDVLLTVMNSMSLFGESANMDRKFKESCDKCFNLEAELLKSRNVHNDLLKKFFENNDLKAQLEDKDSTICKLKDIIKSMKEKSKEENVKYDYGEIETKNVELENSVAKLILENKRLCNEINHVKQVFKEQFDSIKKTRIHTKEQSDSLIDKLNFKSAKNEDLKGQIQDKVFVITSLQNDLRKVKGKEIVDIAAQIPSTNTIVPGMFKLDLEPLAHRLLQNREAHIDYLKYTQEQADILREIVEQAKAKQPLDKELDFACKHAQRIQELLVYVRDTCPTVIHLSAKKVELSKTSDSNPPVLSSTGLKCSTSKCGSKPTSNKRNYRISQTPSRNMKNKVEA
ncbi:integrase, catalytic region, zinc finger, CCHC-type containing protein [Tanacetum coccineum]